MSIIFGILYLLIIPAVLTKLTNRIIPAIVLIAISGYFFPLWYSFITTGICIMFTFGRPLTTYQLVNANSLQRTYGQLFDILGIGLIIVGIGLLIYRAVL